MTVDDETDDLDDDFAARDIHSIEVADAGRLDVVVAAAIASLSRAQVQRLIDHGAIARNGVIATKASDKVRPGDVIEVRILPPEPVEVIAEAIPLEVLFEDQELIVIDKPAGMVVHPAAGHATGTLVNALLYHCSDLAGIAGVRRPGIVHRLDKGTTGVMVAAKTDRAHASLCAQFAAKSRGEAGGVERTYFALVSPAPATARGTLRTSYGRHPVHRKQFSSKVASGRVAVTHWDTAELFNDAALVRLTLETGRTHQIRVHASDHGWPLIGDPVYGHKPRTRQVAEVARLLGRPALHVATLGFVHPATGQPMRFEAPMPPDLARAQSALTGDRTA